MAYGKDPNLESWNPMEDDYHDNGFNCYQRDVYDVRNSQPRGGFGNKRNDRGTSVLYVNKIPCDLTEKGLANMFSKCGNVLSSKIVWPKNVPNVSYVFGFVEFESSKEALDAINMYNLTEPYYFEVKLHKQRYGIRNADGSVRRPTPQVIPKRALLPTPNLPPFPNHDGSRADFRNSPGFSGDGSMPFVGPTRDHPISITFTAHGDKRMVKVPESKSGPPPLREEKIRYCVTCKEIGKYRCSNCKSAIYCSQACQKEDWRKHELVCLPVLPRKVYSSAELNQSNARATAMRVPSSMPASPRPYNNTNNSFVPKRYGPQPSMQIPPRVNNHNNGNNNNSISKNKYSQPSSSNDFRKKKPIWPAASDTQGSNTGRQQGNSQPFQGQKVATSPPKQSSPSSRGKVSVQQTRTNDNRPLSENSEEDSKYEEVVADSHPDVPSKADNLVNMMKTVTLSDKGLCKVTVAYVFHPHKFYCQLCDDSETLVHIMAGIQNLDDSSLAAVACGDIVAAQFTDGMWYRAKVDQVDDRAILVMYIDYGNKEPVDLSKLRRLPNEIADIPPQAICCRLSNAQPVGGSWDKSSVQEFTTLVSDVELFASLTRVCRSQHWVSLTDKKIDGSDIGQLLISRNAAISYMSVNDNAVSCWEEGIEVTLSFPTKESDDVVWGMSESVINKEDLAEILVGLPECCTSESCSKESIDVGTLVAAQSSTDNSWYRGVVLKVTPDGWLVRYLDFGNCEPVTNLCPLPEKFCQYISLAVCLEFDTRIAMEIFPEVFSNEDTIHLKVLQVGDEVVSVELMREQAVGVKAKAWSVWQRSTHYLAETEIVPDTVESEDNTCAPVESQPQQEKSLELLTPEGRHSDNSDGEDVSDVPVKYTSMPRLALPLGSRVELIVVEVQTVDIMFCWLFDLEEINSYDELNAMIMEYCNSTPCPPKQPPKCGELCLAKSPKYGQWYRAVVLQDEEFLTVLFVDFGSMETVKLSDIRPIQKRFLEMPIQAINCTLSGLKSSRCSDNDCEIFKGIVKTNECYVVDVISMQEEDNSYVINIPSVVPELVKLGFLDA